MAARTTDGDPWECGTAQEGGRSRVAAERKAAARRKREARCLLKFGCTLEQYAELRRLWPKAVIRFNSQRSNARHRGIGWDLTLWEWWTVWRQSGLWQQRGRGNSYVMCRVGNEGAYTFGNVFIATGAENSSNRKGKKTGLPTGVSRRRNKYVAFRMIDGKNIYLGTFAAPEEAHAAYLAARPEPKRSVYGALPEPAERHADADQ